MKAIWAGEINFGLVSIPIKLYSAVESKVNFRLIDKKTKTPIEYKRWNPKTNKEVPWRDIVRGLEIKKGEYIVITKEEINKLKPKKTNNIEIIQFVDSSQIDPIYFQKHYYAVPVKKKEKPYFLFKKILQDTAKVAIGKFVMREKEYICAISPYKKGLVVTRLNYAYEIRDISNLEELKNPPKLSEAELKLAKQLINQLYEEEFDISKFKDTFIDKLKAFVKKEIKKRKKVHEIPEEKEIKKTKVEKTESKKNLIQALKASLKS